MILKEVELITVDGENYLTSTETNNELFIFCINRNKKLHYFDYDQAILISININT